MDTVEKLEEIKEKKPSSKKNTAEPKSKKAVKTEAENTNNVAIAPISLKVKRAKLIGGVLLLLFSSIFIYCYHFILFHLVC
jgi:hypothetical protein